MTTKKPCLICCGILKEEVESIIGSGSLDVEPFFLDAGLHADFGELERGLTRAIEEQSRGCPRGIVVIYGDYCHPKMKEIVGKYPNVVKIEAANCIDCLLGGHDLLLKIDPDHVYFYLSPGWMPSRLTQNRRFKGIFDLDEAKTKRLFRKLKGIVIFDPFGNAEDLRNEVEQFSSRTGLPVLEVKEVGLEPFRKLILEAVAKLDCKKKRSESDTNATKQSQA
jgi:hypothetical protein